MKPNSPPNPNWKPGDRIASPVGKMVELDFTKMAPPARYKLLIGAIVPRPIAFVSSVSASGLVNLAPFSFFNGVSSDPPCLMFSVTRQRDGSKKDTLRNIEETGQFVVNTVSEWMAEPMNHCSGDFPFGVDEMERSGLTPVASLRVRPPRVKESPIHMECETYKTVEVGEGGLGSATVVIGRIVMMHVHEGAYADGKIRIEELRPLSRLAGASYGRTEGIFDLPRPKV